MRCLVCDSKNVVEEATQWRCCKCNWTLPKEQEDKPDEDDDPSKYRDMNY